MKQFSHHHAASPRQLQPYDRTRVGSVKVVSGRLCKVWLPKLSSVPDESHTATRSATHMPDPHCVLVFFACSSSCGNSVDRRGSCRWAPARLTEGCAWDVYSITSWSNDKFPGPPERRGRGADLPSSHTLLQRWRADLFRRGRHLRAYRTLSAQACISSTTTVCGSASCDRTELREDWPSRAREHLCRSRRRRISRRPGHPVYAPHGTDPNHRGGMLRRRGAAVCAGAGRAGSITLEDERARSSAARGPGWG